MDDISEGISRSFSSQMLVAFYKPQIKIKILSERKKDSPGTQQKVGNCCTHVLHDRCRHWILFGDYMLKEYCVFGKPQIISYFLSLFFCKNGLIYHENVSSLARFSLFKYRFLFSPFLTSLR